jgi:hypothetical protein
MKIKLLKGLLSTDNESSVDDCWDGPKEEKKIYIFKIFCFRLIFYRD